MTDTTILLGDLAIHEPVTVFTDLIISLLCFVFSYNMNNKDTASRGWRLFFLFFGFSTLVGAVSHAFFAVHTGPLYKSFWLPMQVLNGLAIYCAELATLSSVLLHYPKRNMLRTIFTVKLSLFVIAVPLVQNFIVVVINTALGLIPVMILHLRLQRSAADKMLAYGIMISFLTVIVHGFKISMHAYFNHNDLAHILIMFSLWFMYKGAKTASLN